MRKSFKFILLVTVISLIVLPLAACGGGTAEEEEEEEVAEEEEEEEEEEEDVGEEEEEEDVGEEEEEEDVGEEEEEEEEPEPEPEVEMAITSPAFQEGEEIPFKFSCDGQDISPELAWSGVPEGTQSLALILDDPDAPGGTFTHWVIFNIPADSLGLPEHVPTIRELDSGALQGRNDFGDIGYGGPCPPAGAPHRYYFTIYALDQALTLSSGATKAQLLNAMEGHILDSAELMGTYQY